MIKQILFIISIAILLILAGTRPLHAADAVVGDGTPASCTEANFETALTTVQLSGSGTITFYCGGPATIDFNAQKTIFANITVDGGSIISLNGGDITRLFNVTGSGTLSLKNITLHNGFNDTLGGGAIVNSGSLNLDSVTIRDSNVDSGYSGGAILSYGPVNMDNSLIENNTGGSAGGVFILGLAADSNITNSTFRNNRTTNSAYGLGGAITVFNGASLTLTDSLLEQNQAENGGAVYIDHASQSFVTISYSELRNNSAVESGGAVYSNGLATNDGELFVFNSDITQNIAGEFGGGIFNFITELRVVGGTTSSNSADYGGGISNNMASFSLLQTTLNNNSSLRGGALDTFMSDGQIKNATLSNNSADNGGGIHSLDDPLLKMEFVTMNKNVGTIGGSSIHNSQSQVTVQNVIFQTNAGSNCLGSLITSNGFNLASDASCALAGSGDVQNTDAQLGPLQNNGGLNATHMPQPGSPALDSGQCIAGITDDQRDLPRPVGGICDKGAIERQPNDNDGYFIFLPTVLK